MPSYQRDASPEMPELEPLELVMKKTPTKSHATNSESASRNSTKKCSSVVDINDLTRQSSSTLQRLNALMNNQLRYLEAESKYFDEMHQLQSKYAKLYASIFERRKQIVSGESDPTTDECKWPPDIVAHTNGSSSSKIFLNILKKRKIKF